MKVINYDEALVLLQAQVEKKGADYIYEAPNDYGTCVNWVGNRDGERVPSCIVGHVINDLGHIDDIDNGGGVYMTSRALMRDKLVAFTEKAYALLGDAQGGQDLGTPWGRAVETAIAYVANREWDDAEKEVHEW